jgi:energy-coupling factor transporter ATP-binding protein EcfA2
MSQLIASVDWVDRRGESERLAQGMQQGQSLLIWGPSGAGKTALVHHVLARLPAERARRHFYVSGWTSRQNLLRALVRKLYEAEDRFLLEKLASQGVEGHQFEGWLKRQTSLRLRGLVYRAAKHGQYWIFLDHPPTITHATRRLLAELIRPCNTPIYLLARAAGRRELGPAWSLYWSDHDRLAVGPLADPAAAELLENCIACFDLAPYASEDFRHDVLRLSGGIPGAIVGMCRLAAQPKYHFQGRIKTRLLHLDCLISTGLDAREAVGIRLCP